MKICKICSLEQPLHQFRAYRTKTKGFVHRNECADCKYKDEKRRKKANPENTKNWWLLHKYNMTIADYRKMEQAQNGKCAVCNQSQPSKALAVDHDHNTGKVRGLLCDKCNRGIGLLGDSPEVVLNAFRYLDRCYNGDLKK